MKRKKERENLPTDNYGSRLGTISAKVNAQVASHWKTDEEIASEAKLSMGHTQRRLWKGMRTGVFEHRVLRQYRIAVIKGENES